MNVRHPKGLPNGLKGFLFSCDDMQERRSMASVPEHKDLTYEFLEVGK